MSDSSSSQSLPQPSDTTAYVEQTAQLLAIEIPDTYRDGIINNFNQLSAIAQHVMDFSLPSNTEIAPIFKP